MKISKRGQATIAMKATTLPPQKTTVLERLTKEGTASDKKFGAHNATDDDYQAALIEECKEEELSDYGSTQFQFDEKNGKKSIRSPKSIKTSTPTAN